jgi:hypothetical protein
MAHELVALRIQAARKGRASGTTLLLQGKDGRIVGMSKRATLAQRAMSSLPIFCVMVVILWRAHWISRGVAIAIFLVSLIPLAAAKAFLMLREKEEHEESLDR